MLNEAQQRDVWERWLASEMRANYYGDLSERLSSLQTKLTWLILLFSSGAAGAILGDSHVPASLWFLKLVLSLLAAAVIALSSAVVGITKAGCLLVFDIVFHLTSLSGHSLCGKLFANGYPALNVAQGRQRLQVVVRLHRQPGRRIATKVPGKPGGRISGDRAAFLDDRVNAGCGNATLCHDQRCVVTLNENGVVIQATKIKKRGRCRAFYCPSLDAK